MEVAFSWEQSVTPDAVSSLDMHLAGTVILII